MNIRVVFKNMEPSEEMKQHALTQLQKIITFLENEPTPVFIDLVLHPSKTREHPNIKLIVKTPNYNVISEDEYNGIPFYKMLDQVIDVMYLKLHEAHNRRIEDLKMVGRHDEFKKQR